MDRVQREGILGQLDVLEASLAGLNLQIQAVRRMVLAESGPIEHRVHKPEYANERYTTEKEDEEIDEMMRYDAGKDELLQDLAAQSMSEGINEAGGQQ
jgi:hypothetical protein